jgi:hypothetical protein
MVLFAHHTHRLPSMQCTKHPFNEGCRACSADGSKCLKCGTGSVLVNGTCKACKGEYCASCSVPGTCQKCRTVPAWLEYAMDYDESEYGPVYMDRQGNCREVRRICVVSRARQRCLIEEYLQFENQ